MKAPWESNINIWYDLCIPRNETALSRYFQNRIIMFCLPISTFMYLWMISVFSGSVCLFCLTILAIYINCSQIHECRNRERDRTVSFLGIYKSNFRYSACAHTYNLVIFVAQPRSYLGGGHGVDHRHSRAGHQPHQQSHVQSRRHNLHVTKPMLLLV